MPTYHVNLAVKHGGKRYEPGSEIQISKENAARLLEDGVISATAETTAPAPAPAPTSPAPQEPQGEKKEDEAPEVPQAPAPQDPTPTATGNEVSDAQPAGGQKTITGNEQ